MSAQVDMVQQATAIVCTTNRQPNETHAFNTDCYFTICIVSCFVHSASLIWWFAQYALISLYCTLCHKDWLFIKIAITILGQLQYRFQYITVRSVWFPATIASTQGWNCRGVGGLKPLSSCLQTPIFEWKSALNFNPWAKFQTFRHLTPSPVLLGQFQHCVHIVWFKATSFDMIVRFEEEWSVIVSMNSKN